MWYTNGHGKNEQAKATGPHGAAARRRGAEDGRHRRTGQAQPQSASGRLVQKVLAYISREAVKGIGVEDVARRFKVSRSLLELRFGELQGESVYEAMLRIRLEEVKRLLRNTDEPIAAITAACGWENPAPPKALFKRRFGMSMRDWRASAHR